MRFSRIGTCFAIAGAYLAIRLMPVLLRHAFQRPALALLVSLGLTVFTMLFQLGLVVSVVRLKVKPLTALLLCIASGAIVASVMLIPSHLVRGSVGFIATLLAHDLFLILFASCLGYLVSFIVREPNILLPATIFAGFVDYWGVTYGPVSKMLEKAPQVVEKASVHMPTVKVANVMIASTIGMGDFMFMALFMGVLYRFSMNVKGAFWLGFVLLTVSMIAVMVAVNLAVPALVPLGIAILVTNWRHLKLKREEVMATLYVGILLLLGLGVHVFFMYRK